MEISRCQMDNPLHDSLVGGCRKEHGTELSKLHLLNSEFCRNMLIVPTNLYKHLYLLLERLQSYIPARQSCSRAEISAQLALMVTFFGR